MLFRSVTPFVIGHLTKDILSRIICKMNLDNIKSEHFYYIEFPYQKYGTLRSFISKALKMRDCYKLSLQKYLIKQLVVIVSVMHRTHEMSHNDIKCENLMFADDLTIKAIDFGLSTPTKILLSGETGTYLY